MKIQIILRHVRSEYGKKIRKDYEAHNTKASWGHIRTLEPRTDGLSNTLTTVLKDNLVLEVINDRGSNNKTSNESRKNKMEDRGGVADLSFPTSKTRRGRVQENGNICPTLMANNQDLCRLEADKVTKYRIRKLTPKECWRLMGFSDTDFEKAAEVNSNTHLYAQAGNAIVVNVLEAIFGSMLPKKGEN